MIDLTFLGAAVTGLEGPAEKCDDVDRGSDECGRGVTGGSDRGRGS